MRKTFMGVRLRRLREERGLTQVALAQLLGISPSYLNQIEQNQRPLTVQVLLKLSGALGVDVQRFSEDDEARLVADLRDVFGSGAVSAEQTDAVSQAEIRELAASMPAVGRVMVALERRCRDAEERAAAFATRLGGDRGQTLRVQPMPYEEVRDFFYARHNHVAELDDLAERLFDAWLLQPGETGRGLASRLEAVHGIRVLRDERAFGDVDAGTLRRFDKGERVLRLSPLLEPGQQAFQMATQLAFLEAEDAIEDIAAQAVFRSEEARSLARIGLANYFAGALVLPYRRFLDSAERLRYDIDLLGRRFGTGFETVSHRLSTLQRPGACGVPFFFVRVDRAGNISKRQSATDFHFSRVGGTCPLWNVYEAFAQPGHILTQLASMPDGRTYLWVARTVSHGRGGYGVPGKTFAVGLGCDLHHAPRLVYAKGLKLDDPSAPTPIGAGCKVCERVGCPQRAFPSAGSRLEIDENSSRFEPYGG
jgi:XRE family transcriptional regulator, fatty acid utilization regulator